MLWDNEPSHQCRSSAWTWCRPCMNFAAYWLTTYLEVHMLYILHLHLASAKLCHVVSIGTVHV